MKQRHLIAIELRMRHDPVDHYDSGEYGIFSEYRSCRIHRPYAIDELGKWKRLTEGCIIRAPVPASMTPRVQLSLPEHSDLQDIYIADTDTSGASVRGGTLRLRTGPDTGYTTLTQYRNGTTLQVISKTNLLLPVFLCCHLLNEVTLGCRPADTTPEVYRLSERTLTLIQNESPFSICR